MSDHRNSPPSQGKPPGGSTPRRGTMRRRMPIGHGGPMALMKGDRARDFKGTFRKLIEYLGAYKRSILIVMFFAVASTIFSIAGPKILGQATTKLFEGVLGLIAGTGSGIDFEAIGKILLTVLALYLASSLFSYIQGWIMSDIAMDITYRFRKDIAD
jgi:ATP-binding cassette subfamily B multidrug efflux pump